MIGFVRHQLDAVLSQGHPRMQGWPMVNFYHLLLAVAAYLVLLFLAKQAMLKRGKGFELKTFSLMHNLAMTALSLYMFVQTCRELYIQKYSLWNNPVDPTPAGDGMAHVIYVFYISKFFEFIDSFIIVARFSKSCILHCPCARSDF